MYMTVRSADGCAGRGSNLSGDLTMNTLKIALAAAAILSSAAPVPAETHADLTKRVATYKSMAGFSHVVGDRRFVGYFVADPARCDVTVIEARADDEALKTAPRRTVMQIAASGRSELEAGPDAALVIACTVDADAIKIAPQSHRLRAAQL